MAIYTKSRLKVYAQLIGRLLPRSWQEARHALGAINEFVVLVAVLSGC